MLPVSGPVRGGTPILISGRGFGPGSKVFIGGTAATEVSFIGPNRLAARTPTAASPGAQDVRVAEGDGPAATLAGAFSYVDPAKVAITFAVMVGPGRIADHSGRERVPVLVTAEVEAPGATNAVGPAAGLLAQVGFGASGGPPASFTWSEAKYLGDADGGYLGDSARDRYQGTVQLPGAAPTEIRLFNVAARFSVNGGQTWTVASPAAKSLPLIGLFGSGLPLAAMREARPPGVEKSAVAVGSVAPEFEAKDPGGKLWRLSESLHRNAAVLVFYRGDW